MIRLINLLTILFFIAGCNSTARNEGPLIDKVNEPLVSSALPVSVKNEVYQTILKEMHEKQPFERFMESGNRPNERYSKWIDDEMVFLGGTNMDYRYVFYIDEHNNLKQNKSLTQNGMVDIRIYRRPIVFYV